MLLGHCSTNNAVTTCTILAVYPEKCTACSGLCTRYDLPYAFVILVYVIKCSRVVHANRKLISQEQVLSKLKARPW